MRNCPIARSFGAEREVPADESDSSARIVEGAYPYVYLDGVVLKRSWGGEVRNFSVLVAIGVGLDGHRKVPGVAEGAKEDKAGWGGVLRHLKERDLQGVQLIISDACLGLVESVAEHYRVRGAISRWGCW